MSIKKNTQKLLFSFFIAGLILFSVWIFVKATNYFQIKHVLINQKYIPDNQRKIILGDDDTKNLNDIDLDILKKKIQSIYFSQSIQITKKYPDTLSIEILENNLIAYLETNHSTTQKDLNYQTHPLYGLDSNGQIINFLSPKIEREKKTHPIIKNHRSIEDNILIGYKVADQQILSAIHSLSLIKKMDDSFYEKIHSVVLFNESDKNYLLLKDLKARFYFGKELSLIQLMKIDSLEEDLTTRITFQQIDLRFDDIVGRGNL